MAAVGSPPISTPRAPVPGLEPAMPELPPLELARPAGTAVSGSGSFGGSAASFDFGPSDATVRRSAIEGHAAPPSGPASGPTRMGAAAFSDADGTAARAGEPPTPVSSSGSVVYRQAAGAAAGAAGAASTEAAEGMSEDQIDQLAGQVYGRIRNRLEAELLRERERAGLLADFR
jgi:hypothetical protein